MLGQWQDSYRACLRLNLVLLKYRTQRKVCNFNSSHTLAAGFGCLAPVKQYTCRSHSLFSPAQLRVSAQGTMEESAIPAQLNKQSFTEHLSLYALRVPKQQCSALMTKLRGLLFTRPKLRSIVEDESSTDHRLLLLSEELSTLPEEHLLQQHVQAKQSQGTLRLAEVVAQEQLVVVRHTVELGYSHLSSHQILKRLLPNGVEIPGAFELVGHIAHLNLRDEVLPWKHLIGQVLLDKNPAIKTVVNKVGSIENEYRVFAMEVLAGEEQFVTEVKQQGCRFRLDFSKVYWNSRLEAEHQRLVDLFRPEDTIVDVMAGIGPFAVPAAKKGVTVHANDLNPDSYKYLQENIKLNKVVQNVHGYNMDGRDLIRAISGGAQSAAPPLDQPNLQQHSGLATTPQPCGNLAHDDARPAECPAARVYQHAIMNLPASAIEFVDAFRGAFDRRLWEGRSLPLVHCYAFQRAGESQQDLRSKLEGYLGGPLDNPPAFHLVRSVAPNKDMVCISFKVPAAIAFVSLHSTAAAAAPVEELNGTVPPSGRPEAGNGTPAAMNVVERRQQVEGLENGTQLPHSLVAPVQGHANSSCIGKSAVQQGLEYDAQQGSMLSNAATEGDGGVAEAGGVGADEGVASAQAVGSIVVGGDLYKKQRVQ